MSKRVALVTESLAFARRISNVLAQLEAELAIVPPSSIARISSDAPESDLVILEVDGEPQTVLARTQPHIMDSAAKALLLSVGPEHMKGLRLPLNITSDFVSTDASDDELATRISLMLQPGNETSSDDIVTIDDMTINLATYQVKIDDEPLDLTYLEYALLAFLATHPGKTYSRDMLLKRVWGFDYYGGSRTIDVHVRRVRAKLGPELAQHLQTIRGVGYLWNS